MQVRVMFCLASTMGVACSGNPTPVPARDAYVPALDSGIDAYVPLDAGPPVCTGVAVSCPTRDPSTCAAGTGCRLNACMGRPNRCSLYFDYNDCSTVMGCYWSGERCEGDPLVCEAYSSSLYCRHAGCAWDDTPSCVGVARACSELDESTCATVPGCAPVGGADAGQDGGASDAGMDSATPDAGPSCPRIGCHPLYDASCRCGYSATTFDWGCSRSGSGVVGANCTTSASCGPGLWCSRRTSAATGQCRRLCDDDSDCGAGEGCAEIGEIAISCTGYCLPTSECSISSQNCAGGRACYWYSEGAREFNFCNNEGTAASNASCYGDPTACMGGSVCASRLGYMFARCHPVCTASTSCPAGQTCSGMTAAGETFCL